MFIKNILLTVPGGWNYQQPETGYPMTGLTFQTLLSRIAKHRHNMKLPIVSSPFPTLAAEIEEWICQKMTPQNQTRLCGTGERRRSAVGWQEIMSFLKTNAKWFVSGQPQVEQTEAERRAAICATCPLNVAIAGHCPTCITTVDAYRNSILKAEPTSNDSQLRACGVCSCDLKSIVHLPLDVLRAGGSHKFPAWCWQAD